LHLARGFAYVGGIIIPLHISFFENKLKVNRK
jgi:hypothetical protein